MAERGWTLQELKDHLSQRKDVKGWILTQEHVHRRERYFLSERKPAPGPAALAVDQDRDVRSQNVFARIFVPGAKPGHQGEITKKLFPSLNLKGQIDAAVETARETDHQAWELPAEAPSKLPQLQTTDPAIAEDVERAVTQLTGQIASSVAKNRATAFNSAELFLSIHDRELHLSNGLIHRSSQSRIYAEAAYSMSRRGKGGELVADEYLNTAWSVGLRDLSIERLFDETSERAENSLDVSKPITGKYPVVIDAEVLATLFNGHLGQLSGSNSYHRLPFVKPGDELIAGAAGDLVSMSLDPFLELGADTTAISEQGVVQAPLKLVERNRVLATIADKQFADYLSVPASTARGNLVVEPGSLSRSELTRAAPKVLEILQFSGLFTDPNSGTFGSEIRLARLHDNVKGTVSWIKGGSLSGSIAENFKQARFSRERVKRAYFGPMGAGGASRGQGYFGPELALMNDVSVVG
jgi:predicted Zn-dependent protease